MNRACSRCGAVNRPQSRFCRQCGQPLPPQTVVRPRASQRWRLLGGSLLVALLIGLVSWWGVTNGLPHQLFSTADNIPVAQGVDTPAPATPLPPLPATATSAAPVATPTPSPTPEPLIIPGLDIELPHLSDAEEIEIGQEVAREVEAEYGILNDAAAQQRVEQIGQRIAPHSDRPNLTYHFKLLNTAEVNAFAAPGGFIFVTRGMLEFANPAPDDELASVLGHEIAHVAQRHGAKQIEGITLAIAAIEAVVRRNQDWEQIYQTQGAQIAQKMAGELLLRGWSRNQEFDADHYGIIYMRRAGYNPNAAVTLFWRMQQSFQPNNPGPAERLLSTHPPFADRIVQIEEVIAQNP